jgi:hypothetical protein
MMEEDMAEDLAEHQEDLVEHQEDLAEHQAEDLAQPQAEDLADHQAEVLADHHLAEDLEEEDLWDQGHLPNGGSHHQLGHQALQEV